MAQNNTRDVVILGAVRTPIGKFRGALSDVRADHLGALVLNALTERSRVDPSMVDDVVFGCVTQVGEQCGNLARTSLLSAGWPETIPGMTVDRKCGSGEAAIHTAVGQICAGAADVVVAGGAESMTRVPMGGNRDVHGDPFGWKLRDRFEMISQGEAAERLADRWELTRAMLDGFSVSSQARAGNAAEQGYFASQIVPIDVYEWRNDRGAGPGVKLERDETIRPSTSLEKLGSLKPSFRADGRMTAGNSSQISDGAAAVLLASADAAERLGVRPRALIRAIATVGSDPTLMLTGPITATRKALDRAGLSMDEIDLFEVNEAFASVPLVWMKEIGAPHEKLNVNGGAIALGHPLGATGARILTTLLHELERRDARFGLQTICCAGGLATATVIERLG
jgi:acetyl-CoA acyltransferase